MKVLICDDSALARKSVARCIADSEHQKILFAGDGQEALDILKVQNIDVMFLDLTMPVLDGYEVLSAMPVSDYPTKVIVVSGDVQQAAKKRCKELGAYEFIEKPLNPGTARPLFPSIGLTFCQSSSSTPLPKLDPITQFKELTNIALGRGAAIISDHLGEFIHIPIPNVGLLSPGELAMTLEDVLHREGSVAVAQRFVGGGIHGEALVCMRGTQIEEMGQSLGYKVQESSYNEVVINIANLLVASYLVSLGEQMCTQFALRQPAVIDHFHQEINSLNVGGVGELFTVEYTYFAESIHFECEVLFLIDSRSVGKIKRILETM
ncbi:response regulator [Vibrio nigripulchritudo]|uniref:response regulator n=1 Tax=Vibrio nigripulchritudo TaxID=28173 RepID=UPI0005F9BC13|nr:response regulator [Vibrio nigripulchritudo]KJY76886.1 chemotaxis protein CheC [Vibrio nigripulchritudo]